MRSFSFAKLGRFQYIIPFVAITSPFFTRAFMSSGTSSTTSLDANAGQGISLNFNSIPLQLIKSESEPLGESISSESLWRNQNGGAIIMVVRRPG